MGAHNHPTTTPENWENETNPVRWMTEQPDMSGVISTHDGHAGAQFTGLRFKSQRLPEGLELKRFKNKHGDSTYVVIGHE